MWARMVEFMLGCWLAVSPFVFGHPYADRLLWITDFACALAVIALALLSYWQPTRHAHFAILLVATALIVMGRTAAWTEVPAASQNHIVIGLLLLMFAIVPNNAGQPPEFWRCRPADE